MFDRATRKFKGDPAIWMAWLKFCKDSQSKRQVSKVITKALKLHPTAPYFWAYAAAWCVSSLSRLYIIRCTTLCCMPAHPGSRLYSGATLTAVAPASEPGTHAVSTADCDTDAIVRVKHLRHSVSRSQGV